MTLIIVDLLRQFIEQQPRFGAFDTPEAFFEAMQDFLNDKKARQSINDAWMRQMIQQGINSGPGRPHDEVFAELKKRSEQMLDVRMREVTRGITTDRHAIDIILSHIRDVEHSMGGLQFDTFEGITYMHRVVERVIYVVNSAVWVLPPNVTNTLNQNDMARLKELSGRTPGIGEPLSAVELWEAVGGILPRLELALNNKNVSQIS